MPILLLSQQRQSTEGFIINTQIHNFKNCLTNISSEQAKTFNSMMFSC